MALVTNVIWINKKKKEKKRQSFIYYYFTKDFTLLYYRDFMGLF